VPSTGFTAAGMTYEKASGDPAPRRVYEQYLTQWVSLSWGAANADDILARWHGAWVEALRQGQAGELEPNEIVNPGNELVTQVPDRPLRHWFLRADDPSKTRELRALIRRLQRMDVTVYRLSKPLTVPDYKAYAPRAARLPAGTYWVPMAQAQKHWVQAMLNEDTYTPFPYFYDVTGWSNPLLFNLRGGSSGAVLDPAAARVRPVADPGRPRPPSDPPTVGLYHHDEGSSAIESAGWLRYLLDNVWRLPYRELGSAAIAAGGLKGTEVLLVPNGSETDAADALGPAGQQALADWVAGGGRFGGRPEDRVAQQPLGAVGEGPEVGLEREQHHPPGPDRLVDHGRGAAQLLGPGGEPGDQEVGAGRAAGCRGCRRSARPGWRW